MYNTDDLIKINEQLKTNRRDIANNLSSILICLAYVAYFFPQYVDREALYKIILGLALATPCSAMALINVREMLQNIKEREELKGQLKLIKK